MKKTRLTDEQIIRFLKQVEARAMLYAESLDVIGDSCVNTKEVPPCESILRTLGAARK